MRSGPGFPLLMYDVVMLVSVGNKTCGLFPRVREAYESRLAYLVPLDFRNFTWLYPILFYCIYYFLSGKARFSSIYPLMVESKIVMRKWLGLFSTYSISVSLHGYSLFPILCILESIFGPVLGLAYSLMVESKIGIQECLSLFSTYSIFRSLRD